MCYGLAEIRDMVSPARHAGLRPDQAGGHLRGDARAGNITLLPLPPYARS